MSIRQGAIANDAVVEQAAQEFLVQGGSAVGAVLCGYFAAAGAYAGVLLGPVSVLVGGVGSRIRAFDGRLRQPGRGARRPRGFVKQDEIPDAARVAIPAGLAAVLVAHAYDGAEQLGPIVKSGVRLALRDRAEARAALLERVREIGAAAFTETGFVRALLREAGPAQGGLLTPVDFSASRSSLDRVGVERAVGDVRLYEPPWAADPGEPADGAVGGYGVAVCAVDVSGVFAALHCRRVRDGFAIEALEIEAPLAAVPVRRGVRRTAPGTPLPAPAPIALRVDATGAPLEVMAAALANRLDAASLASGVVRLRRDPRTGVVDSERT